MSTESITALLEEAAPLIDKCAVVRCDRQWHAKGLCLKHYKRMWKGGNPHIPSVREYRAAIIEGDIAKIPLGVLAKDGYAIVDKEFAYLDKYSWALGANGYAFKNPGKPMSYLHHHIAGIPPKGFDTDHINRNKLDNRRINLRHVTRSENNYNTKRSLIKRGIIHV